MLEKYIAGKQAIHYICGQMNTERIQIHTSARSVEITLQRSRKCKRSLSITVLKNGEVILRTPYHTSMADLQHFAISKTPWIIDKLKRVEVNQAKNQSKENTIRFMGEDYLIQVEPSPLLRNRGFCELAERTLSIYVPSNLTPKKQNIIIKSILENWYQTMAAEIFTERADIYAAQLNLKFQSIKLADPKRRWGSCDKHGRIMFSWRAVMLPLELIDYLIIHELCHILHFDHSKLFWHAVEKILPDYKIHRKQLRLAEETYDFYHF